MILQKYLNVLNLITKISLHMVEWAANKDIFPFTKYILNNLINTQDDLYGLSSYYHLKI